MNIPTRVLFLSLILLGLALHSAGASQTPIIDMPGTSLGIAWGMIYGQPFDKDQVFMPQIRQLGAGFTKIILFWSQLEPQRGVFNWAPLDALLNQIASPHEAILTIYSSSPWATRSAAWVFPPSAPKDPSDYVRFIKAVVAHVNGRIRYFQNGSEPSNPMFWAGTREEFVDQIQSFAVTVRSHDKQAQIVLGGSDGVFDPSPAHHIPNQEQGLAFFDYILQKARTSFDIFDLHLYADPYTIPARVEYFRNRMRALGDAKPIICTEYNGPGFFEFPANRKYSRLMSLMGTPKEKPAVAGLYAERANLPPETQMFLADAQPDLQSHLEKLQARDLVIRNVLAFSAGIQKMAFWDLWHDSADRDLVRNLVYGKLKLMEFSDGKPGAKLPLAAAYSEMASHLSGVESVTRIPQQDESLYLFLIERKRHAPELVGWTTSERTSCTNLDGGTDKLCFGSEPKWIAQ